MNTPERYPWRRDAHPAGQAVANSASTNSSGSNSTRSSTVSPRPTSLIGMPERRLDGERDAALGRAVELGEHDAGEVDRLGELLRLHEPVLAGGGVEHEQHLGDLAGLAVGDPAHLAQLLHQVDLGVEPTGGVGQHEVGAAGGGPLHGVEDHRARVAALGAPHEVGARPARPRSRAARRRRHGTCRPRPSRPSGPRRPGACRPCRWWWSCRRRSRRRTATRWARPARRCSVRSPVARSALSSALSASSSAAGSVMPSASTVARSRRGCRWWR